MWFIFLISAIIVALVCLLIVWVGHKVYISIKRQNKWYEMEDEVYEGTKKEIKKQFKEEDNER